MVPEKNMRTVFVEYERFTEELFTCLMVQSQVFVYELDLEEDRIRGRSSKSSLNHAEYRRSVLHRRYASHDSI